MSRELLQPMLAMHCGPGVLQFPPLRVIGYRQEAERSSNQCWRAVAGE